MRPRLSTDRLSALVRPMIDAVENEWASVAFHACETQRKQLLRRLHEALAELAEWEEGYR